MKGIIEEVKDGKASSGNQYCIYTIGGKKYSTFDYLTFQTGDEVEFEFVQTKKDGKTWNNLTNMQPAIPKQDTNDFIIREVAIKAAAEAVKQCAGPYENILNIARDTILIAKEFEAYIKNEPEPTEEDIPF